MVREPQTILPHGSSVFGSLLATLSAALLNRAGSILLPTNGALSETAPRVLQTADAKAVNREGQTTIDMANGPVQRVSPWPDAIKYLESLGVTNNHKCLSC